MFRNVLLSVVVLASLIVAPAPAPAEAETAPAEFGAQTIDSDAVTDRIGLVDPATGIWFLRGQGGVVGSFFYGNPGDVPFVGDWDCDGIDTPGLYRQSDGFAYLRNSNSQGIADIRFFFGNPGDFPLAGDFDGDGCDTLSIYRPSEATIYVINELGANDGGLGAAEFSYIFGNPGDKPFVGDFDGDGIDTLGLHRESTGFVYFRQTHTQGIADEEFFFGDPGDRLVSGDWGVVDGEDTPAIFRPSNSTFFFRYTNTQGIADETLVFGASTFLPIAGEWGTVTGGGPGQQPPGPQPLMVSGSLPNATVEIPYSAQIGISGGSGSYTVEKVSGPPWAAVSTTGVVSGTPPTNGTGLFTLEVRVTDSAGAQVTSGIPLRVVTKCQIVTGTTLLQCQALSQLYTAAGGSGWTEQTNWFSANPCTWFGVTCLGGNVTAIELDDNGLLGSLEGVAFNQLPSLTILDVGGNGSDFGTTLPDSLVALPLTDLDVSENAFFGDVPLGLWEKAGLVHLDLSDNDFAGVIPAVTWNAIQTLDLSVNEFSGDLPVSLWTRTTLTSLDLAANGFTGMLPTSGVTLTAILGLDLGENQLEGPVPAGFVTGLNTGITGLDLHGNNLGGVDELAAEAVIPLEITGLTGLVGLGSLELHDNACFTAAMPEPHGFVFARDPIFDDGCPLP